MPVTGSPRERVQFPIRALFVFTLLAAILVSVFRWLLGLVENPLPVFASTAIGLAVGVTSVLIIRHVSLTCLLSTLLLVFVLVNGLWFSGSLVVYGCGLLVGAIVAWKGNFVLNALLAFCGFTVSTSRSPIRRPPNESRTSNE